VRIPLQPPLPLHCPAPCVADFTAFVLCIVVCEEALWLPATIKINKLVKSKKAAGTKIFKSKTFFFKSY